MTSGTIPTGHQQLHYLRWDGGDQLLLAFHGYGNQAGMFASVAAAVRQDYTTISFDLPHHGKSDWQGDAPWQKAELVETIRVLMKDGGFTKADIVCFSIGGRIGLTLAEQCPELIGSLILIASDGLVPNRFYRFVTQQIIGKKLFHHFLEKPDAWIKVFNWLAAKKWIHASRKKFVDYYTGAPAARSFLQKVWPNLRLMVPDLKKVKQHIREHGIKTHLLMGKYDHVIPLKHAIKFAGGDEQIQVHILPKGHRIMDDQTAAAVAKILLGKR